MGEAEARSTGRLCWVAARWRVFRTRLVDPAGKKLHSPSAWAFRVGPLKNQDTWSRISPMAGS